MYNVYFVCASNGEILNVIVSNKNFDQIYKETVELNNGEFLATISLNQLLKHLNNSIANLENPQNLSRDNSNARN